MQVLPDAIIINASPSQRRMLRDPAYRQYTAGLINPDGTSRPRIQITEIAEVVSRLAELKNIIVTDPAYSKRRPIDVIDRIILAIEDAAAVQKRTYPRKSK
jgi:hypothetical protein